MDTTNATPTVTNGVMSGQEDSLPTPSIFPCLEQPMRVTLHCNGYYLWGLRNGRVVTRKKRSERDEFRLNYGSNGNVVEIHNHKFGGAISVVQDGASQKIVCVKEETENAETQETESGESAAKNESSSKDTEKATQNSESDDAKEHKSESDDAAKEEDADGLAKLETEPALSNDVEVTEEDKQWCFVKGTLGRNEVLLKSLKTGDNLGIDADGNIVFVSDTPKDSSIAIAWDVECVTGELCYISNNATNSRVRCDIAGLLTVTDSWKGWEVFRFMEAGHGYVKISSWMHSQWLLCSSENGTVTTCSHAESFLEDKTHKCSKWAVEKDESGDGVVIRSKSFGRLLCVKDGMLRTKKAGEEDNGDENTNDESLGTETNQRTITQEKKNIGESWRSSMQQLQNRLNKKSVVDSAQSKDTSVWQIEAAHRQTYYTLSVKDVEIPRSIGPFPFVTANIRQTEKIQLEKGEGGITKLFHTGKEKYIACLANGEIELADSADDTNTEWLMDKPQYQSGGSIFRSKAHNRYLSYEDPADDDDATMNADESNSSGRFPSMPFQKKREKVTKLVGSELLEEREVWKLEPCMPRAVSSEKIKTFALGTSIAVGTTIAMPFALAGVGALLGAVGAEVGLVANAIAVGLTGAEALASVGAIGATAYIVFRPEDNSLTDKHDKDEGDEMDEAEKAWSKRPFADWKSW